MAALAGHGHPGTLCVDEAGNPKASPRAEHRTRGRNRIARRADRLTMLVGLLIMTFGRTTQSQFVRGMSSPRIGPAMASIAERGCTDVLSRTACWIASSIVAKSAVRTLGKRFGSA
jgi:hypothetical protein